MSQDERLNGGSPEVDPWAPGGAMSDPGRWGSPGDAAGFSSDVPTDGTPTETRVTRVAIAVVGLFVVVGVAVVGWQVSRSDSPVAPAGGFDARDASVEGASVGQIAWLSVVGDADSLPASIVEGADGGLLGRDDGGALSWTSVDGSVWDGPRSDVGDIEVAGVRWSVDRHDGRRRLVYDVGVEPSVVPVADQRVVRDGVVVSWEVRGAAPRDVLLEVDGELFARLDRREEVDWRALLGIGPGDGYRVHAVGDDVDETFASDNGSVIAEPVELSAQVTARGVELSDTDGTELGVVGVVEPAGEALDAMSPTLTSEWARWDGDRFIVMAPPWSPSDIVEVASVGDRAIAVATIKLDSGPRIWGTGDGVRWEPVALPVQPSDASPMPMTIGRGEIALSVSDGTTTSFWSTADAVNFERLPQVPGINRRSQGSFGWIAPDPRSSPLLRVSADGTTWTDLDLSDHLGYDASRWDGQLEAIAIGNEIYVTSTVGEQRTVLIGTVNTATASS